MLGLELKLRLGLGLGLGPCDWWGLRNGGQMESTLNATCTAHLCLSTGGTSQF